MLYLSRLRQILARVRGGVWNYPDTLFLAQDSLSQKLWQFYISTRPFSHFGMGVVITIGLLYLAFTPGALPTFARGSTKFVEGVVVGLDQNGLPQTLSKVSPLLPTAIQLEKDISELIYEPLIRFEQDGNISMVLAESIVRIKEGAEYEFVLRPDVFWHDGKPFGLSDVFRSLEIVSEIEEEDANSYVQAIKQMAWEPTGERSLLICTVRDLSEVATIENPCTGATGEKPILANFLELISIKIIPAHLAQDINARTIDKPDPLLNRFPIGTGKYKFAGATAGSILLDANQNYYGNPPLVSQIQFKLFGTEEQAVAALKNSEIHGFVSSSTEFLQSVNRYPQIRVVDSPVLYNQYWAIYLNLRKSPQGEAEGPAFFSDPLVRKAISLGVNRESVLDVLSDKGKQAVGPIPEISEFYASNIKRYNFNQAQAIEYLNQAGWVGRDGSGIRVKDGIRLSFTLSYVNTPDRNRVVESIRQDLSKIGVELKPDPRILNDLTTQVVTPKQFEALLYGMNTFIDPDRFELFHSSQGLKLNLAGYVGQDQTAKIEQGKTVRVPRVDRLLEQARSYDPLNAKKERKEDYIKFQELIAEDSPVIFLYHPQFVYMLNVRVNNVNLDRAGAIEQRFRSVGEWRVE